MKKIEEAINLNAVNFVFCSHNHKDHSLNLEKLKKRGLNAIYEYSNTFAMVENIKNPFNVLTFPVKHGECPNWGCIVNDVAANTSLLYITDFNMCQYNLGKFNFDYLMLECNYVEKKLEEHMNALIELNQNGEVYKARRQINTHQGLDGLCLFLNTLNIKSVKCIFLIHCSTQYGNEIQMASKIHKYTGKVVGFCKTRGGINYYGGQK